MENKLLIYEQDYDVVSHNCIIEKSDLEDFIQERITKFLEQSNTAGYITYAYISHDIKLEEGYVTIVFRHSGYECGGTTYPPDNYQDSFCFIELDKMPIWVKKTKVYSTDAQSEIIKALNARI